tara:strand:- start:53223 stop:53636 length:414 start_codon:yes stop_codon:yes gene_type:complete
MKTFHELEILPSLGDTVKFVPHSEAIYEHYRGLEGKIITNEPKQTYTVVDISGNIIKANGNISGHTYWFNDAHWRPVRDTTPIDWRTRKDAYRDYKKYKNVSAIGRKYDISRRSVGRIVAEIEDMSWFRRTLIKLGF